MIHHVEGRISEKPVGRIIVDVGGFGLEVHVSTLVWNDAGFPGDLCRLLTHASIREDAWTLYGFLDERERALFRLLLAVQGIGPKVALAILSALPVSRLSRIVIDGDVASLIAVPGVGKKTASRILIDLKDKLAGEAMGDGESFAVPAGAAVAMAGDAAVDALVALGYPFAGAREAVRAARAAHPETQVETVLKDALRRL